MSAEPFERDRQSMGILEQIHNGMEVYDRSGGKVGTVEAIYFGGTSEAAEERGRGAVTDTGFVDAGTASGTRFGADDSILRMFAEALGGGDDFPDTIADRLRHNGFIRIDTGILRSDRFATPDQIASIEGERVILGVASEDLISR